MHPQSYLSVFNTLLTNQTPPASKQIAGVCLFYANVCVATKAPRGLVDSVVMKAVFNVLFTSLVSLSKPLLSIKGTGMGSDLTIPYYNDF